MVELLKFKEKEVQMVPFVLSQEFVSKEEVFSEMDNTERTNLWYKCCLTRVIKIEKENLMSLWWLEKRMVKWDRIDQVQIGEGEDEVDRVTNFVGNYYKNGKICWNKNPDLEVGKKRGY
jgi:hypothetical protein